MSRVLVVWPPQVLSYFNAGHHSPLYTVAAYLRARGDDVDVLDGSVERVTWKELGDRLFRTRYDVLAVMNELGGVDGLPRLLTYARELSPATRIVTFGRLSGTQPSLFRRFDLDGIVENGDYEAGVEAFVRSGHGEPLPGVHVRDGDRWLDPAGPGTLLPPEEWVLPEVAEIPYESYDWFYRDDSLKFCGIPERRELIVPAARGCPVGCEFCEVPAVFGRADRRLSVGRVVEYIERSFAEHPFEYVSFYAPTFTLDRRWVVELCEELVARGARYPWKCATTMHHLDPELVALMGRSGCIRISVGVETLEPGPVDALPRVKRKDVVDLETLAELCDEASIELNCFVIVGLPGTSVDGAVSTAAAVRRVGARVRPTIYVPTNEPVPADAGDEFVGLRNRQILVGPEPLDSESRERAYAIVFGDESRTAVAERIPSRKGTAP